MSNAFTIGCLTCANPNTGRAPEANIEINWGIDEMTKVLALRPLLEALGPHHVVLERVDYEASKLISTCRFFHEHAGHDIAVIDEYGEVLRGCNADLLHEVPYVASATLPPRMNRRFCRLKKDHEGPHSPTEAP